MKELDAIVVAVDTAGLGEFTAGVSPLELTGALQRLMEMRLKVVAETGGEVITYVGDGGIFLWEASGDAGRQAEIGEGLVRLQQAFGSFDSREDWRITSRMAVAAGPIARTDHEYGGARQMIPLLGKPVDLVRGMNSAHRRLGRDFLVAGEVPVIWPRGVALQKVGENSSGAGAEMYGVL